MLKTILLLGFICMRLSTACGLDDDAVQEMKCIPPPKPEKVGVDMNWFATLDKVYVPLWSKFYAHRTASDMFGRDSRLINEWEMGPSSCLMMKKGNFVSGFGREIKYNISGDAGSLTFKAPWSGAKIGKFSFHLTDNKSFVLGLTCWEDNETSWSVMSSKAFLEPEIRSKVLDYVKTLGFDVNNAVDENYSYCGHLRGHFPPPNFMNSMMMNPYMYFGYGQGMRY